MSDMSHMWEKKGTKKCETQSNKSMINMIDAHIPWPWWFYCSQPLTLSHALPTFSHCILGGSFHVSWGQRGPKLVLFIDFLSTGRELTKQNLYCIDIKVRPRVWSCINNTKVFSYMFLLGMVSCMVWLNLNQYTIIKNI